MNFDDLDAQMRLYETAHDHCVMPNIYMVARIDGRGFTRMTREMHPFEHPFDVRFRDYMVATTAHLMACGFRVVYGFTQSDEISLLIHRDETAFARKLRKYDSILVSEASAKFSLLLGEIAAFDCRICQLPNPKVVIDYFRWRQEDAHRNALTAHCYWFLRDRGESVQAATHALEGLSLGAKNEMLFHAGVNFNALPEWQKRGIGLYWENYDKAAVNLKTGEPVVTQRRRIRQDENLPVRDEYAAFIGGLVEAV
jgi:tRNA(His) 5'-end guanylyltransferase